MFKAAVIVCLVVAMSTSAYGATLVGHWSFDEGAGTIANDASGYGNNGTLMNGATWTVGKGGMGLSLDGVDDYVIVPDAASLRIGGPFTIIAWLYPKQIATGHRSFVNKYYNYMFQTAVDNVRPGRLRISFVDHDLEANDSALTLNEWQRVAVVWDGSYFRLYKNGLEVASEYEGEVTPPTTGDPLYIGCEGGGWQFFNGIIDEVEIYNGALSEAELNETCGARGDANGDSNIDVGDAVYLINYIFKNGPAPVCE